MTDTRIDRPDQPRYTPDTPEVDAIAAELMQRLRPLLGGMPETELTDLVRAIARRRHRWDQQARTRGP
ncbi:MAG: hypothetical protein ACXWZS_18000 [Gemmatirosa sp.]